MLVIICNEGPIEEENIVCELVQDMRYLTSRFMLCKSDDYYSEDTKACSRFKIYIS